mgnify:CR=1 FL=1
MNKWFGDKPWGQICNSLEQVPAPIGELCLFCEELIAQGDDGELICSGDGLKPVHRECLLRMVVGSIEHQQGRCSCHGGNEEVKLSKRESAIAATKYFEANNSYE